MTEDIPDPITRRSSAAEIFQVFLKLGLTSFGGPIAHLGHFRRELIEKRNWLSEEEYAQLIGLTQFLPGPASSQLGFTLGLLRGGWLGGLLAFIGFTLPSALLMFACAVLLPHVSSAASAQAVVHGLKLVALAVVADGLYRMSRKLCPDLPRIVIAVFGLFIILSFSSAWMQLAVVAAGGMTGLALCTSVTPVTGRGFVFSYRPSSAIVLLVLYSFLLLLFLIPSSNNPDILNVMAAFYRAGALVFGGGHVVLPLLEESIVTPGWVSHTVFLAGYGAAQAVPGPMFSFSAYLGASISGSFNSAIGSLAALIAIFLPGFLLVSGILPFWQKLASRPSAARAVAGVNAAVVGLLAAALYDPIWVSAVKSIEDFLIALVGLLLLLIWRVSALWVVVWCVAAAFASALVF